MFVELSFFCFGKARSVTTMSLMFDSYILTPADFLFRRKKVTAITSFRKLTVKVGTKQKVIEKKEEINANESYMLIKQCLTYLDR